jgi:hypothetical protein
MAPVAPLSPAPNRMRFVLAPTVALIAFLMSDASIVLAQSAFSGSTLTIGAGLALVGVGLGVVVALVVDDGADVGVPVEDGLTTMTLLAVFGPLAAAELPVIVLTTVTVRWVVDPELHPTAVRVTRSKEAIAVRRMRPTVGRIDAKRRTTRRCRCSRCANETKYGPDSPLTVWSAHALLDNSFALASQT